MRRRVRRSAAEDRGPSERDEPLSKLVRRMLGLGMKRRQYERGKEFFEYVVSVEGVETATRVWDGPENLPSDDELDHPEQWLARIK
ncbi:zinc-dependent metalloprotease [Haladaptatus pallidirubidus]|uniref:zinc-dependent metalloprotease n=1 Tax=Haladaptatus pallidirubidus TaxID=1008152 RepID=UPI0035EA87E6